MIEQTCLTAGNRGLKEEIALTFAERRTVEERHDLIENGGIARDLHIKCNHVWEPDTIVGHASAYAATRFRQPPVLNVPLDELSPSRAQHMRTCNIRTRQT